MSQPMSKAVRVRIQVDRMDGKTEVVEVTGDADDEVRATVDIGRVDPLEDITLFGLAEARRRDPSPRCLLEVKTVGGVVTWREPQHADEAAEAVLVAHQRHGIGGCLCGWSELGKSHPGHQVAMLRAAAL